MTRAIRADARGGAEVLKLVEIDEPVARADDVVIRVAASGVNYADIMCREGTHPGMPAPPIVLGCEGSGVVESIGRRVDRFEVGDRVSFYSPPGGSYAERAAVVHTHVFPIPDAMSFEDGAAFTHVFLTAYHALVTFGHARAGETILVTAAAGGVGTAILQLARELELDVLAGVGSSSKVGVVEELGARRVVDYRSSSLSEFAKRETGGRGVDLALESVGGDLFDRAVDALAPLGRIVMYGIASGDARPATPERFLSHSASFSALNFSVVAQHAPEQVAESWRWLMNRYEGGKLRAVIGGRFALAEAPEAHRRMESRESVGKLVLIISPDLE